MTPSWPRAASTCWPRTTPTGSQRSLTHSRGLISFQSPNYPLQGVPTWGRYFSFSLLSVRPRSFKWRLLQRTPKQSLVYVRRCVFHNPVLVPCLGHSRKLRLDSRGGLPHLRWRFLWWTIRWINQIFVAISVRTKESFIHWWLVGYHTVSVWPFHMLLGSLPSHGLSLYAEARLPAIHAIIHCFWKNCWPWLFGLQSTLYSNLIFQDYRFSHKRHRPLALSTDVAIGSHSADIWKWNEVIVISGVDAEIKCFHKAWTESVEWMTDIWLHLQFWGFIIKL